MRIIALSILFVLHGCATMSAESEKDFVIPEEQVGAFRAAGVVVSFDELCLKQLSTSQGLADWQRGNSEIEAAIYKKSPNDKAYLIGNELATFILVKQEELGCSVFGENVDGKAIHENLQKVFLERQKNNPGSQIKVDTLGNLPAATLAIVLLSSSNLPLLEVIVSIKRQNDGTESVVLSGAVAGGK